MEWENGRGNGGIVQKVANIFCTGLITQLQFLFLLAG